MSDPRALTQALVALAVEQAEVNYLPSVVLWHPRDTASICGQAVADRLSADGRADFEDGSFLELVQDEDGVCCRYTRPLRSR